MLLCLPITKGIFSLVCKFVIPISILFQLVLVLSPMPFTSLRSQTILLCSFLFPYPMISCSWGSPFTQPHFWFTHIHFSLETIFLVIQGQLCCFSSLSCGTSAPPVLITSATASTSPVLLYLGSHANASFLLLFSLSFMLYPLLCLALVRPRNRAR